MNKKAALTDGLYLIIALFVIGIVFLFSWRLMDDINTNMQASDGISTYGKSLVSNSRDKFVGIVDNAFLLFFVGLIIAMVAGAYFIRVHPALFWFSIPIIVFFIFIAAIYGNIFYEMSHASDMLSYTSDFTFLTFIFDNFIYFIVGAVLILSLALFAKNPDN